MPVQMKNSQVLRDFAAAHELDLLLLDDQAIFPLYGMSNGIIGNFIAYFRMRGYCWPSYTDMGREGKSPLGIMAVEIPIGATDTDISEHLLLRLGIEKERIAQ